MEDVEEQAVKQRPSLQRHQTLAGLQLSCYRVDPEQGTLVLAPLEDAIARRQQSTGGDYWIDADVKDGEDALELQNIIQEIRLTRFLTNHLSKPNQIETPQVLCLPKSVFFVMRVLPPEEDLGSSDEQRCVAALGVEGLLLTVSTFPREGTAAHNCHELNVSTRKSVEERPLPEASTSGALALWLLQHVRRVATVSQKLRKTCFAVDQALDRGIETVELEDIVDLKNQINLQVAVTEEQLECLETLKEGETLSNGLDFSKLPGSMGLVLSTAGANERMAARLEKKVADLRTIYDSHRQDRINHRLEVLTIVSAIFLPLTLMAGIWGMNFQHMPELHRENSYYYALASMLAVASVQLALFYRQGWLDFA